MNNRDSISSVSSGIVRNRSCTDIPSLIIFVIYVSLLVAIFVYAIHKADYRRLSNGVDQYGNICGYKNRPIKGSNLSGQDMISKKYFVSTCDEENCTYSCEEKCPDGYKVILFKHCEFSENINDTKSRQASFNHFASDFVSFFPYMMILCVMTAVLSFLMLCAFRFLTLCFLWAVLFIFGIAVTLFVVYLWMELVGRLKQSNEVAKGSNIGGVIVFTLVLIYCFVIIFIARKKMVFVLALVKEVGKALCSMPFIYLLPIFAYMFHVKIMLFLTGAFVSIQFSGKPEADEKGVVTFPIDNDLKVGMFFLGFGYLWLNGFIIACQHLSVSGSVSQWYFTRDKSQCKYPILKSVENTFLYHLGSAALGSLLTTIFTIIRKIIERIKDSQSENQSWFRKFCLAFIQCCCACIENIVQFATRNAYIMVSMEGESFCSSARKACQLLSAHLTSFLVLQAAGDTLLFVSKIAVIIAIGFSGFMILVSIEVTYVFLLLLIVCALAYVISTCFFSIFEMAIDTMLLDYCEDCRQNDGKSRPYFMSENLKSVTEGVSAIF